MNLRAILAKLTATVLPIVGFVSSVPLLATSILRVIGFSSIGPVAGSLAAFIQSFFYGGAVASGSIFAFMQSTAMTLGGAMTWGGAIISGSIFAIGKISKIFTSRKD